MKTALFDIDGTLSDPSEFLHLIQEPPKKWKEWHNNVQNHGVHHDIVSQMRMMWDYRYIIFLVTARSEICRPGTIEWLDKHKINEYHGLIMRDNKDFRPDHEVKLDVLTKLRNDGYDVKFAFEDRDQVVQMYRNNGVRCFQVTNGDY